MTVQSASSAGRGPRPLLVFEVLTGADLDLGAVDARTVRIGQAQAVGGQHVLAVLPVRPLLVFVADAGPEHQLGARAGVVPVGQAAAKDAERLVGVERPLLGVAAVAGPDVDLVAVGGVAPRVVETLAVGPLDPGAYGRNDPVEGHPARRARLVGGRDGHAVDARGGGGSGDQAGGPVQFQVRRQAHLAPGELVARGGTAVE